MCGELCYEVSTIIQSSTLDITFYAFLLVCFGLFGLGFLLLIFREKCTVKITLFSLVFVVFVEKNVP